MSRDPQPHERPPDALDGLTVHAPTFDDPEKQAQADKLAEEIRETLAGFSPMYRLQFAEQLKDAAWRKLMGLDDILVLPPDPDADPFKVRR
jgi:hypothetical protein